MPNIKSTMLIRMTTQNSRTGGWSESFVSNVADFTTAAGNWFAPMSQRALFLPTGSVIVGQRYVNLDTPGLSTSAGVVIQGTLRIETDMPQATLLVNMRGGTSMRLTKLKNIPDSLIFAGDYIVDPVFDPLIRQYLQGVINGGYGFIGLNRTNVPVGLISIDILGNVVTASNIATAVGGFVTFFRTRDVNNKAVRGQYPVTAVTSPTVFKVGNFFNAAVIRGRCRLVVPKIFIPIANFTINRTIYSKVGRPFGLFSGRRSVRR